MPNLQGASQATHEAFEQIVLYGLLEARGMPSFAEHLSADDAKMIQAYIVSEAQKAVKGSTK
jgi:mono/diheme cytochrome c family protein